MFITTEGIVLRTYPFKDNKLIIKLFTKDFGMISCIMRKTRSQFMLSGLLTIAEITYKKTQSQSLYYIKEASIKYFYKSLTSQNQKIQCSLVLCEILNKCLNEKNPSLYDLITTSFKELDRSVIFLKGFDSLFILKLCNVLGIQPLFDKINSPKNPVLSIEDGEYVDYRPLLNQKKYIPIQESYQIIQMCDLSFRELEAYDIEENLNNRIFRYLILYISHHLTDLTHLKSLEVIKDLS